MSKKLNDLLDELHTYVRQPSPHQTSVDLVMPAHLWEEMLQQKPSLKKLEK